MDLQPIFGGNPTRVHAGGWTVIQSPRCIYTEHDIEAVTSDGFALLADPVRRRVVEILCGGERSVHEIVDQVDSRQSGLSRHLRFLHEAGFVTVRSDGQRRNHSLRPEAFEALEAWMRRYAYDQIGRLQRPSDLADEPPKTRK